MEFGLKKLRVKLRFKKIIDEELTGVFFIAGPCALESFDQVRPITDLFHKWNLRYFRAQLFKPRTHPHSFQGLGKKGLPIIDFLLEQDFQLVSEAASLEQLEIIKDFASVIQIGARNMQNFEYLKTIGKVVDFHQPKAPFVMLKRGFANTLDEWLASAQYLEIHGVPSDKIILCERGTRNSSAPTGITLDMALAYEAKQRSSYAVILDPSHGTRKTSLVLPLAKASLAMDLNGIMVEIHPFPAQSKSDAQQAVSLEDFDDFLETTSLVNFSIGRKFSKRPESFLGRNNSCETVKFLV